MPFQPTCSMCVADCDSNSVLTNCQHFICSRCWNKYPKGQCPRCHKACKTLSLSAPNFPVEVQERLRFDVKRHMTMSIQALEFQQRLEQGATQRLKEIMTQLQQQLRSTMQQLSDAQRQLHQKSEEAKTLQVEVNVLRDQLREVHMSGRSSSSSSSHHHNNSNSMGNAMMQSTAAPLMHNSNRSSSTPAMSMIPMHNGSQQQQGNILMMGGGARSPSGFRCDFGDASSHNGPGLEAPPLSPFGLFGSSRAGGDGVVLPPTPHPQHMSQQAAQHQTHQQPKWSPSSATATPLGWSRDPTKRPRDEQAQANINHAAPSHVPPAGGGGMSEHFRLGHMQPLSQHAAAAAVAGMVHTTGSGGVALPQNLTPLPKLKSLLSNGGARLVRPSSGHEFA
ncbi:transmembrane protein, putative [Bodo saltans]|uniref:Transmembrane protein, putative n=1 Tax=Bodo saltans TaxID=75058 RepID=A0A0S4JH34_BODSA|nr:transmembrane protein, putative [Bodo saltans]|eukprot:CUG88762.1 transmembrane protein, putative [Bodo saltans]